MPPANSSTYDAHATLRELQTFIATSVRNDWAFPPTAQDPASAPPANPQDPNLEYRERYYGTSSPSSSDSSDSEEALEAAATLTNGHRRGSSVTNPYKFDNPDSIGQAQEERTISRKRKKIARVQEEMEWNAGLAFFEARRNAWTRAVADPVKSASPTATNGSHISPNALSPATSAPSSPTAGLSTLPQVPVTGPFLPPDHPMRKQASSPSSYADIYTRIVAAGTTPKIPINALHITRSLVQGWKESGEWPPRPTAAEPAISHKRVNSGSKIRDGILAHHPHVRRGVEGMKRVFRLSGSNHTLKEDG